MQPPMECWAESNSHWTSVYQCVSAFPKPCAVFTPDHSHQHMWVTCYLFIQCLLLRTYALSETKPNCRVPLPCYPRAILPHCSTWQKVASRYVLIQRGLNTHINQEIISKSNITSFGFSSGILMESNKILNCNEKSWGVTISLFLKNS